MKLYLIESSSHGLPDERIQRAKERESERESESEVELEMTPCCMFPIRIYDCHWKWRKHKQIFSEIHIVIDLLPFIISFYIRWTLLNLV